MAKTEKAQPNPAVEIARNSYHFKEAMLDLRFVASLQPDELAKLKAEVDRIAGGASGNADTSSSN